MGGFDLARGRTPVGPAANRRAGVAGPRGRSATGSIEELQRAAGNRAVAGVLQRTKLNIRDASAKTRPGTISGVSGFPNRPPTSGGKQGQHLTAYVVFEDTILSHVRERTPEEAATQLAAVALEFRKLPSMQTDTELNRRIHVALDQIAQALTKAGKSGDPVLAKATVEEMIGQLLAARNVMHGVTVSKEGTTGHGEAKHAGGLETMESQIAKDPSVLGSYGASEALGALAAMWRLLDYNPPEPADLKDAGQIAAMGKPVLTHVLSLRLAYPRVWEWLTGLGEKFHLLPWLQSQKRAGTVLPLPRLSDAAVAKVQEYVYANL